MRMGHALAGLLVTLCLAEPGQAFDCADPPFGAALSSLDDGNFVPYRQSGGVTYANYVGPCRLPIHEKACPAIAHAFVDGVYYARIVRATVANVNDMLRDMPAGSGGPVKVKDEGGVSQYVGELPGGIVMKLKYDTASGEATAAVYDKRLRETLARRLGEAGAPPADWPADLP